MAKITSWRCDGCKTVVQQEELPDGWKPYKAEGDPPEVFHFCAECLEGFRSPVKGKRGKPRARAGHVDTAASGPVSRGTPTATAPVVRPKLQGIESRVLRAITEGAENHGAIIQKLHLSYGSITHAVSRLATKGLITKPLYGRGGFKITQDGERALQAQAEPESTESEAT